MSDLIVDRSSGGGLGNPAALEPTQSHLTQILAASLEWARLPAGAVFTTGATSMARPVAVSGITFEAAERLLTRPDSARAGEAAPSDERAPVFVAGRQVAVVVAFGDGGGGSLKAVPDVLLTSIGLAVDRLRLLGELEERAEQVTALRHQLDAYALDFRSTYEAERARSHDLAAALSELEQTYRATVRGLAIAVEAKDECTGGHLHRVTRYGLQVTALVAPDHARDPQFEYGFLLHDVGKLTVPDAILTKAGPLGEEEWELIRRHPASGRTILESIPFLEVAREIVYSHHERWDGKGYPRGLRGEEIPLGAKIFPLCDSFDAMTVDRPYRAALPVATALAELRAGSGTQFWPVAVEAFLDLPLSDLDMIRAESASASAR